MRQPGGCDDLCRQDAVPPGIFPSLLAATLCGGKGGTVVILLCLATATPPYNLINLQVTVILYSCH